MSSSSIRFVSFKDYSLAEILGYFKNEPAFVLIETESGERLASSRPFFASDRFIFSALIPSCVALDDFELLINKLDDLRYTCENTADYAYYALTAIRDFDFANYAQST